MDNSTNTLLFVPCSNTRKRFSALVIGTTKIAPDSSRAGVQKLKNTLTMGWLEEGTEIELPKVVYRRCKFSIETNMA